MSFPRMYLQTSWNSHQKFVNAFPSSKKKHRHLSATASSSSFFLLLPLFSTIRFLKVFTDQLNLSHRLFLGIGCAFGGSRGRAPPARQSHSSSYSSLNCFLGSRWRFDRRMSSLASRHFWQTNTSGTLDFRILAQERWTHVVHSLHSIMGLPENGLPQKQVTLYHSSPAGGKAKFQSCINAWQHPLLHLAVKSCCHHRRWNWQLELRWNFRGTLWMVNQEASSM